MDSKRIPHHHLSVEGMQTVKTMYESGMLVKQIADSMNISMSNVGYAIKKLRLRRNFTYTDAIRHDIAERYVMGEKTAQIADVYGLKENALRAQISIMRKNGYDLPRRLNY